MSERKPYKTDLSDEQWALVEPVIVAWKAAHRSVSGHQGRYEMREIVNALLYQGRTGCQWDLLSTRRVTAEGLLDGVYRGRGAGVAVSHLAICENPGATSGWRRRAG